MSSFTHKCDEAECCYTGQPSPRECGCHRTPQQMLEASHTDLLAALRPFADIGIPTNPDYMPTIRLDRDAIIAARAAIAKATAQ